MADARRVRDDAKRVGRETGRNLGQFDYRRPRGPVKADLEDTHGHYPHDTHPILVPGIAIDEQRRRYSLDTIIFAIAGGLTVAFVIWGITSPSSVATVAQTAYDWATLNVGWLFNIVAIIILVSLLILAFSSYGKIPLGKDGEKAEFSTFSWVAMLFAAGIGHDPFAWCTASRLGGGIGLLIRPRILFVGSGGVICHVSVHTLSIVAETAEIDRCRARRQTHHGPMA